MPFPLAGRLHPEQSLATNDPSPGKSSIEPDTAAPASASSETRSDAAVDAPFDGIDPLSLFTSETEIDASRSSAADDRIRNPNVSISAPPLTALAERNLHSNVEGRLDTQTGIQGLYDAMDARLFQTERALRRTEALVADRSARVDQTLIRTQESLLTLQGAVAEIEKTLHELCASIARRSGSTEEMLRRVDASVSDRTLQQLAARIDTRLADTNAEVHRIERLVRGSGFRELSVRVNGRLLRTEEALRRIVGMLEAPAARQSDAARHDGGAVKRAISLQTWRAWTAVTRMAGFAQDHSTYYWNHVTTRVDLSRMAARAAAALLLLAVLSVVTIRIDVLRIGLPGSSASSTPQPVPPVESGIIPSVEAAPLTTSQTVPQAAAQPEPTTRPAPVVARPSQALRRDASQDRTRDEATMTRSADAGQFFGTLVIDSMPSGASVFINGRSVGITPLTVSRQQAGSLAVQITREGFRRWSAAVQVRSGVSTRVNATLLPNRP